MRIILLAVIILLFVGCESESVSTSGGTPPGDISGTVALQDTLGGSFSSNGGVLVTIEGTSYKTTSDSSGHWLLKNIPVGTYVLSFEKEGFGMSKIFNIQHTGNGVFYFDKLVHLVQLPSVSVDVVTRPFELVIQYRDTVVQDSNGTPKHIYVLDTIPFGQAQFSIVISSGTKYYANRLGGLIYFSKNPTIDPRDITSYDTLAGASFRTSDTTGCQIVFGRKTLLSAGFKSGEKIFLIGAVSVNSGYYDPSQNNKYIYTGYGKNYSPIRSFILP